jgi:hypothetical protein
VVIFYFFKNTSGLPTLVLVPVIVKDSSRSFYYLSSSSTGTNTTYTSTSANGIYTAVVRYSLPYLPVMVVSLLLAGLWLFVVSRINESCCSVVGWGAACSIHISVYAAAGVACGVSTSGGDLRLVGGCLLQPRCAAQPGKLSNCLHRSMCGRTQAVAGVQKKQLTRMQD